MEIATEEAERIGFPLMLKAASGGGGRGMRVLRSMGELEKAYGESRREAKNAFGDETVFLEKFIENPKHIEIQIVEVWSLFPGGLRCVGIPQHRGFSRLLSKHHLLDNRR